MIRIILIGIILFGATWVNAFGATETFYLTANGNGNNEGAGQVAFISAPNSLSQAMSIGQFKTATNWDTDDQIDNKIGPNDVVLFYDDDGDVESEGLYFQQPGLSGKPIWVKAAPGESPVINANGVKNNACRLKSYTGIQGIEIYGAKDIGVLIGSTGGAADDYTHCYIDQCYIHDNDDIGIAVHGKDSDEYTEYIYITNNTIEDIGSWGNSGDTSILLGNYTRRITIKGNTIIGNGTSKGVDGITTDNCRGAGNIISQNICYGMEENCLDFKDHWESAESEGDTEVIDNDFSETDGPVVIVHHDSQDVNFRRNKIYNGNASGVMLQDSDDADGEGNCLFEYNLIYDNAYAGVQENNTTSGPWCFYYNTIVGNGRSAGQYPHAGLYINISNYTIENNIIAQNGESLTDGHQIYTNASDFTSLDYNIYEHYSGGTGKKLFYFDGAGRTLAYIVLNTSHSDNDEEAELDYLRSVWLPLFIYYLDNANVLPE